MESYSESINDSCSASEISPEMFEVIEKEYHPEQLWEDDNLPEFISDVFNMKKHGRNVRTLLSVNTFDNSAYLIRHDLSRKKYITYRFDASGKLKDDYTE